jgi:hypothetical protein
LEYENEHISIEQNPQRRFSVNVWWGILGNRIIGPIFINGNLNQEKYYRILTEDLVLILDNMPLNERNSIVLQQDGATAYSAIRNREVLNGEFGENWMGTYGRILWPPRSCDLTPMDIFLLGAYPR